MNYGTLLISLLCVLPCPTIAQNATKSAVTTTAKRTYLGEEAQPEQGEEKRDMEEDDSDPEDFINRPDLQQVAPHEGERTDVVSVISSAFNNRKTFSCPKIKTDLLTGTSIGDLSPEDIGIIASMGDALATGEGLWPQTDIEFRGAAFPIGGDATIDGLVTIPTLTGVSHGMGSREQLPEHQLSVAKSNATSSSMPEQATELVRRIRNLRDVSYTEEWVMVIITVGTQEICSTCMGPDVNALQKAIDILSMGLPKAFVVLLGPVHVSSAYKQKANLLKDQSDEFMVELSDSWTKGFKTLQKNSDDSPFKGCPYFRTTANARVCQLLSLTEAEDTQLSLGARGKVLKMPRRTAKKLYLIAGIIYLTAFLIVCILSTYFYQKSKEGPMGRFDTDIDMLQKSPDDKTDEIKVLLRAQSRKEQRTEDTSVGPFSQVDVTMFHPKTPEKCTA